MKILLTCTFLFFIILFIDIKMYGIEYHEEEERMEKEDELLKYLQDKYDSIMSSIIEDSIQEVVVMDLNNEESIIIELQQKVFDKFSTLIVGREEETILKQLNDELIKSYISLKLIDIDVSKILTTIKSVKFNKKRYNDETQATEIMPDNTKVDSSIMDITDNLNNIFFKE